MDFRVLDAQRLTWMSGGRVAYGAGKFQFQTPPARYATVPHARFGGDAVDLVLHWSPTQSPIDAEFVAFLRSLDAVAGREVGGKPGMEGRRFFETLSFHNDMRLTVFGDAVAWFSEDGSMGHVPSNATGTCSVLVELAGYWTSAASWGLKFKALEAKDSASQTNNHDYGYAFVHDE